MNAKGNLVTFTDGAASRLREVMAGKNQQTCGIRLAVVRTHCMGGKGYENKLALEDSPREDDEISEHNGIKLCVDPASASFLRGAEVDFVDTPEGAGFKVNNPNVVAKCPCGHHDIFE
jgi:iron-sulfur cluster assembly protein